MNRDSNANRYESRFKCESISTSTPTLWCSAPGPAEAWRTAHPARGPSGGEPDAGAVRQAGGRKHQDEASDGRDLRAFNGQRQAVVQVEVTSFSPPPFSVLHTVAKVIWWGPEQTMDHNGSSFAACFHYLLLPKPWQLAARFLPAASLEIKHAGLKLRVVQRVEWGSLGVLTVAE